MTRHWVRVLKLLLVSLPVLLVLPLFNEDVSAGTVHVHDSYVHDHITAAPKLIAEAAAQNIVSSASGSSIESVSAAPASAPSDVGQWSQVLDWPLVAVHEALMPDGQVLMWDAWEFGASPSARLWDPLTQSFISVPNTTSGLFCAGMVMLPDGRQLVSGGHNGASYGINHTNIFDWRNETWTRVSNMNFDRWYPTTIELGDGHVLILGGQADPNTYDHIPELFDPATNAWTVLNQASIPVGNYPYIFLMPNGKVFNIVDDNGYSSILDVGSQTWQRVAVSPLYYPNAVMYRPGKLMMAGGATDVGNLTDVIDLNQPSPTWRATAPMAYGRFLHNLVSLPDGKVLVVGGSTILSLVSTTGVLQAEMWDPDSETWTQLTPMQKPRMYHSTALLLPDARVLVAGGGRLSPAIDYPNAEIYSPPYLFKGARPTINAAPTTTNYGANMGVDTPDAASITSVSFVRLSSVTHAINTDQRYIPLTFTANAGSLTVQAPGNSNIAPPGYYMLFILNGSGVPSVAKIVLLGGQSQPVPTDTPGANTATPLPATLTATPTPVTPTATPATPTATAVVGGGSFPTTSVLDNFNRANGALGSSWSGASSSFAVNNNQMDVLSNGAVFWNSSFGSTQEVYTRIPAIDSASDEIDLLLKSQANNMPDAGVIEVLYQPSVHLVQVWTYTPTQNWVQRSSDIPLTLQPGDQFGAKARADGFVEIYRNGTLIGTCDARGWPYYSAGGYIGLWLINSNATFFDDFGGGNSTGVPAPTPTRTPTFTSTPSLTPSYTPTATNTPVIPPTPTFTFTPSLTPSYTPTATNTPVIPPTPTFTFTPSLTPSYTSTATNTPTATTASSTFPLTPLLDNFNWANGALPATWTGARSSFAISNGQMAVLGNGAVFWNARFGANQEVFVTLRAIDVASEEIDLLLKSQINNTPDAGVIEVLYIPSQSRMQVWTYTQAQNWQQRGADIIVALQPGERFGARARADGYVEVYRNEALLGIRDARAWTYATGSGFVGLWLMNSRNTLLDDFGGGNVP
jgi:galactose oxidase-like protein/glyoxal oxidase-like protein/Kelch motif protein